MRQQRLSYGGDTMLIVQKFGGTSLEGRKLGDFRKFLRVF